MPAARIEYYMAVWTEEVVIPDDGELPEPEEEEEEEQQEEGE